MSVRIGPKMREVARYVEQNPGRPMMRAARRVGPNGSLKFGYAIVHRAIAAGLISYVPGAWMRKYLIPNWMQGVVENKPPDMDYETYARILERGEEGL